MSAKKVVRRKRTTKKTPFKTEVTQALEKLASTQDHIRLQGAVALEMHPERQAIPSIIKHLKREHFGPVKFYLMRALGKTKDKRALPVLKSTLFDFEHMMRGQAADMLAEFFGWKRTIDFIKKRFRNPADVPRAFFYDVGYVGGKRNVARWRKSDWRSVGKQVVIDARKIVIEGRKQKLDRMKDKSGKPFSVNGIPVFLGKLPKDYLGFYKNGVIIIQKNTRELDPRDREVTAWHEFGEIFSHEVGLAFEVDFLKRNRQLDEYLRRIPEKRSEFEKIEKEW